MPHSLHYCYTNIVRQMEALEEAYDRIYESGRLAREINANFEAPKIVELVHFGLKDFIASFLASNAGLSDQLEIDFKFNSIG